MLGSVGSPRRWGWTAAGKHPVAKDYFWVGDTSPIVEAFAAWVEKGYQHLAGQANPAGGDRSWRFWTRGAKRDAILCGVVKSSSDAIGRDYPLLITGSGPLEGYEGNWNRIASACEDTWRRMEYLAARRLADFGQLESEVKGVRPPEGDWSRWKIEGSATEKIDEDDMKQHFAQLSDTAVTVIPLSLDGDAGLSGQADLWHSRMMEMGRPLPQAVFLGGPVTGAALAVFERALTPRDFVTLWTFGNR